MKIFTVVRWGAVALILAGLSGCGGSDGSPGAPGADVPTATVDNLTAQITALQQNAGAETCALCHTGATPVARSGLGHQDSYDELYQNGVIKVTGLTFAFTAPDTTTLTFTMTKNGTAFDCTQADSLGSYWSEYDPTKKTFSAAATTRTPYVSLAGTKTYVGAGVCTMTKKFAATSSSFAKDTAAMAAVNAGTLDGIIQLYGTDEIVETVGHLSKGKFPFAGVLRKGPVMGAAATPFVSAANVSGCENCHTQPFNKHAYIPGTVDDLTPGAAAGTTQQFYVCKGCHSDDRTGNDGFWQLLKEAKLATEADAAAKLTTPSAATKALRDRAVAVNGGAALTTAESTKYAYKAKLMNDVHMSHNMEFGYPQSMRNCATCHANKMDATTGIFKTANFKAETCISCHAVDGIVAKMKAASYNHSTIVVDTATLRAMDCTKCHDGSAAPSFSTIHTGGYDPLIYTSAGVKYANTFVVSIDSASVASNVLTVNFSATGTSGSLAASSIKPTVLVGLYGYGTKDYIVGPHIAAADGKKNLEYLWGDGNPRFTPVSAAGGKWVVKADLSLWADKIKDGTVKRAEIAIMPQLKDAAGNVLGLDAPSKTFDLTTNKFDATFFKDIVNVKNTAVTNSKGYKQVKGCNTCHDQLATTFHDGMRGGNIKVCRLCHTKASGGSHLEMQSRSIDSYVHAIHSFQEFDIKNVNFADTFDAMEYASKIGSEFPRFGAGGAGQEDCESCHVNGTYGVPDQSKSMPALLSASATITSKTRNIGAVPSYVTGPAATACGSCHRSDKINADDAGGLLTIFQHWKQNGYLVENVTGLWDAIVAKVMAPFK